MGTLSGTCRYLRVPGLEAGLEAGLARLDQVQSGVARESRCVGNQGNQGNHQGNQGSHDYHPGKFSPGTTVLGTYEDDDSDAASRRVACSPHGPTRP